MRFTRAAIFTLLAALPTATSAGTLVTNDGSFVPAFAAGTPFSQAVTTSLTQVVAAPTPVPNSSPSYTPAINLYSVAGYMGDSGTGGNMLLRYGTGTNCGTGTTTIAIIANANTSVSANSPGVAFGTGLSPVFTLPAGVALCVIGAGTIVTAYTWGMYAIY